MAGRVGGGLEGVVTDALQGLDKGFLFALAGAHAQLFVGVQDGFKVSQKSGSVNSLMDRLKDWFVGNF